MNPLRPAAVGIEVPDRRADPRGPFVGHTMVQHSLSGDPLFLHRTIDKHEDPYRLNWHLVAATRAGSPPALELARICPDAKIKARIVPRSAALVEVSDFDARVPRGRELRRAFETLASELRTAKWMAASS
eukprot:gnl/TRDRNA2_/TRDRNA2_103568_c0_seq2.p1 gnl/TRDRNA2_/TRDRNA2_103568_c0~~gnl/TRDRNA2_/TRDRNA2_103568_c0_seq2.p1  ORF type:complete len:130 (-),score=17.56 gnl/TRDRNA2_/TRDRNA2_103568_c0_seq2:71-460(-)